MLLVLPLLVIPFLTLGFWALGGGRQQGKQEDTAKGLNPELPAANLKDDKEMNKLGFYEQADKDSMKMEEWMRTDPYYKKDSLAHEFIPDELSALTASTALQYKQRLNSSLYDGESNNPEEKIMQKLKLLEREMNAPPAIAYENPVQGSNGNDEFTNEVDRLEQMLKVNNKGADDPEMKQLDGTLDKILDIQHPQRVKERSLKNKEAVYAVRLTTGADTIVTGFYSYSEDKEYEEQNTRTRCVRHSGGTSSLVGATRQRSRRPSTSPAGRQATTIRTGQRYGSRSTKRWTARTRPIVAPFVRCRTRRTSSRSSARG